MKKSYLLIAISMALVQGCYTAPPYQPSSRVSGYPGVNIGISYSRYPDLVRIPGYPVYYAPRVDSNYFFYDGLYWVFQGDNWYASSWYNGPWDRVGYYDVPAYVLRVPVRYYRQPPPYFRGWRADAPPRWGDHWGRDWEQRRRGWDRWDRGSAPAAAPLPIYQRNYSGDRYPRAVEQQHTIRSEHYRYQPREPVTQQYFRPRVQQEQQRQQEQRLQEQRQQEQRQQEQRQHEQRQQEQRQHEQRQQEQRQHEQRQQEQRQQEQRQKELQRQQEQRQQEQRQQEQRQKELQRQQEQRQQGQRQQEQRQQEQRQNEQRQNEQRQNEQRQNEQRQQEQQRQDLERQRSQPEPKGRARDRKAAPQDQIQKEKDAQEEYERKKKEDEERYQSR